MKLIQVERDGESRLGVVTERGIVDVKAAALEKRDDRVPATMTDLIRRGREGVETVRRFVSGLTAPDTGSPAWLIDEKSAMAAVGPAVPPPEKIVCVGLNYRKHADETKLPYPPVPLLFNKFPNALTAHGRDIAIPSSARQVDYEVELGIVIGKRAREVEVDEALDHVFGYCTVNDVSARDWQMRTSQWMLGKTSDGFCPAGPYLVTTDEAGDPQNLALRTWVNGELRQNSNTSDMIFTCAEIVSYISRHITLSPGDLILTGTPEGVVMGLPEERRVYLQPGDEVTVEVEGLGRLTNRFAAAWVGASNGG